MNSSVKHESLSAEKTMELLWLRMRQRGDLPGFSKVLGAIIGAMQGDDDREFNMTKTVLQDPALTQKVLRLANSAMYSVFGPNINTVSKAVIVLGIDIVGHLALGLKLIDGLSAASNVSAPARTELEKAVVSGHVARQVAAAASAHDAEEAVVCSMLHSLGRMMVTFYLPEHWQIVQEHCTEGALNEQEAACKVLSLEFSEIGRHVAQQWGLPASLVCTLHDVRPQPITEPLDHSNWLAAVATLSLDCAAVLCADGQTNAGQITDLAENYADMLGLEPGQLLAAVERGQSTAVFDDDESPLRRSGLRPAFKDATTKNPAADSLKAVSKPLDAASLLTRGVADISDAVQSASTSQLMTMALETVYQGLKLNRVVAFLRNPERARYVARLSFGDGIQELLPRLEFDDAYQPDVFHVALSNDKMIFVENALAADFINKVPRWWKEVLPSARGFVILPLVVNRQPLGLIYGDWDRTAPGFRAGATEIAQLNELRVLISRAVARQRQLDPFWTRRMV